MTEYSEDSSEVRYPDPILVRLPYKPWFPGGKAGLAKYFETNLQYPEEARKNNVEGRIKVSLIVTEKGKVKDIETTGEHIGFGLEEEAIRLVRAMPDWVPGRQGGRAVKVKMTVPVDFDIMH
nr:energy transducer TonB [Chitinophaga chungangae]